MWFLLLTFLKLQSFIILDPFAIGKLCILYPPKWALFLLSPRELCTPCYSLGFSGLIFTLIGENTVWFFLTTCLGLLMKGGQLTLSNLILKFLIESKPLILLNYHSMSLLKEIMSFRLYLSVTPGTLFVLLAEELNFSYLWQIPSFAAEKSTYLTLSKFLLTAPSVAYLADLKELGWTGN